MIELNDMDENDLYDGGYCNRFGGTDGSLLPTFIEKKDVLDVFVRELCRNIQYYASSKRVWHSIIPSQRFNRVKFNDRLPENDCFCIGDADTCPFEGFLENSICTQIPAVFSEAHGLNADPKFFEMVNGLEPDEKKHFSFADINLVRKFLPHGHGRTSF